MIYAYMYLYIKPEKKNKKMCESMQSIWRIYYNQYLIYFDLWFE